LPGETGSGEFMTKKHITVYCIFFIVLFISGCATFPRYQRVTDGLDRKQYQVVGRVLNSFQLPVEDCQIYLTKRWPSPKKGFLRQKQHIPVAITDQIGDYSFIFEGDDSTEFFLYFDARVQGYKARYIDITHLFTSELFQYSGNNPVVVDAVLIPDKIEIQSDTSY